jgi:energy-coupling factor transporter ATP-binding protein EcfA2
VSVRIERLAIRDFGPLRELLLEPGDVTVVYGPNEAGKTSCIDALVRALRDRVRSGNSKLLEGFREGPGFTGDIQLELVPPEGGPLIELLREHPSLARLFIVRDADASLEGGRNWLNAIRGRLIGIDLGKVAERARAAAALTASGDLRDAKQDERQRLAERLARVEAFLADLPAVALVAEDIERTERQRQRLRERCEKLRVAERHERYRVAREALLRWRAAHAELAELERYGEDDLGQWREGVTSVRAAAAVAKSAEHDTHRLRDELALATEDVRKKELAAEHAVSLATESARRDLEATVNTARMLRSAAHLWSLWRTPLAIVGTLLLLLAVGVGIEALAQPANTSRSASLGLAAGAAAFAGLLSGALAIFATSRMRTAAQAEERAIASCGALLRRANTLEDCATQLAAIGSGADRAQMERTAAAERKRQIEATLATAQRIEAERLKRLDEAQRKIADVRERVRLASLDQLEDKLRQRTRAASARDQARATLASLLGEVADGDVERRIEALAVPDPGVAADPNELLQCEQQIEQLDARLMRLRTELGDRRERTLATIGLPDLSAAEAERDRLAAALAAIDRDAAAARLCTTALSELAQDIDRPLREALGPGPGGAGAYLARLTAGRYRSVVLDGDGRLAVERKDGTRFGSEALSRGARDQLSLAVRLALVRRLLGEPGFLVLDDAFLSSDATRREALATALAELAQEGWQIIYFTFDGLLRDRLAQLHAKLVDLAAPTRILESA